MAQITPSAVPTTNSRVSGLQQQVQIIRFSIEMLAIRVPQCGPGCKNTYESYVEYTRLQGQLDGLMREYEETMAALWLELGPSKKDLFTSFSPRTRATRRSMV